VSLFAVAFTLWGSPVTWLEIVAFALSLAMVAANMRVHVVAWPLAIAARCSTAAVCPEQALRRSLAAAVLRGGVAVGLVAMAARQAPDGSQLQVRWLSPRQRWAAARATLAAWPLLGLLLARATDSDVPYFDALPTVASVTGQLLLGRKFVENWLVWLGVNVVSVGCCSPTRGCG
jgi:nicotinamide mononucleotide transporter